MSSLDKYTDEELFQILGSNVEEEIKHRGYEFGWYKKTKYAGWIYILVNPSFESLIKIGYTDNLESRLKSLNKNSGLPDPFHVYAAYKVKKRLDDLKLHKLIDSLNPDLKHSKNREFYEMSPDKAYTVLSAIAEINGDEDLLIKNPLNDPFFGPPTGGEGPVPPPKPSKGEKLTFSMLGIPVGTDLVYTDDESVIVKTADDKSTVVYNGVKYTMSGLVTFLKSGGSWQGGRYFVYQGRRLTEIKKELEKEGI